MEKNNTEFEDQNDYACTSVFRLHKWMISECESELEKEKILETYFLLKTIDNGDCLFHSIHLFLLSVLHQIAYTTYELRHAVAKTVLETDNKEALSAMETWKIILQSAIENKDRELQKEYRHALPLLYDSSPFNTKTRHKLFQNMLNTSTYWGDQYAIQILESKLNVQFLILKKAIVSNLEVMKGQVGVEHASNFNWDPNWFAIFILDGNHYMPLIRKRKHRILQSHKTDVIQSKSSQDSYIACFRKNAIPEFIQRVYGKLPINPLFKSKFSYK